MFAPLESQEVRPRPDPPAGADCIACSLSRLFFKALQGTLLPTQLQLARQLAKRSPKKLSAPHETQGPLPGEARPEPSEQSCISVSGPVSQNCTLQGSWHTAWTPGSPEASREASATHVSVPLRGALDGQASGSSGPPEAALGTCLGDPKTKPPSTSRAAAFSSIFSLSNLSSLNWISSLSLVNSLGSVFQFSRGGLQTDKREAEFLPRPPPPDPDLCGLGRQATDYF